MRKYLLALGVAFCASNFAKAQSTCFEKLLTTGGGSCKYQRADSELDKTGAQECCNMDLTGLGPVGSQLNDFSHFIKSGQRYWTSFTIESSQVFMNGKNFSGDLSGRWIGGQPTDDTPCIAAKYSGVDNFTLFPVNCSEKLLFACITAVGHCACTSNETCTAVFANSCDTSCVDVSTTATDGGTEPSTRPTYSSGTTENVSQDPITTPKTTTYASMINEITSQDSTTTTTRTTIVITGTEPSTTPTYSSGTTEITSQYSITVPMTTTYSSVLNEITSQVSTTPITTTNTTILITRGPPLSPGQIAAIVVLSVVGAVAVAVVVMVVAVLNGHNIIPLRQTNQVGNDSELPA